MRAFIRRVVAGGALAALGMAYGSADAAVGEWTEVRENPFVLTNAAVAVDGATGTLYSFGGVGPDPLAAALYRQDLSLPHTEWVLESPGGGPSARSAAHAFFDERRRRLLVIGGQTGFPDRNDAWAYDPALRTWSPFVEHSLDVPRFRSNLPLAYDRRNDRLLYVEATQPSRVWSLPLAGATSSWSLVVTTDAPWFTPGAAAACDSATNRLFVLSGGEGSNATGNLWQMSLATGQWSILVGPGPLGQTLAPWIGVDPVRRSIVGYGFLAFPGIQPQVRAVEISLDPPLSVLNYTPSGEPREARLSEWTYDPRGRRFVSSWAGASVPLVAEFSTEDFRWRKRHPPGRPLAHELGAHATDPSGRAWYLHGGFSQEDEDCAGVSVPCNSSRLHRVSLDDPASYEEIVPLGAGPGRLRAHAAVFDSIARRILFHGGIDSTETARSETWVLELGPPMRWSVLETQGAAPVRFQHGLAIDVEQRFVYAVGGNGPLPSDVWRLDLSTTPPTWTRLGAILPGGPMVAGFDVQANRLVLLNLDYYDTVGYTVDLGAQPPLVSPRMLMPPASVGAGVAWDVVGRRLLVHNGYSPCSCFSNYSPLSRLLAFDGATFSVVTATAGTSPTAIAHSIYDPVTGHLLSLNGRAEAFTPYPDFFRTLRPSLGTWTVELVHVPRFVTVELVESSRDSTSAELAFHSSAPSVTIGVERWTTALPFWTTAGYAVKQASYEYSFQETIPPPSDQEVHYRGWWMDDAGLHYTSVAMPTPTRLDLVDAVLGDGGVRIRFAGEGSGGAVRVERRETSAADWVDVGAAIEATPGIWEFVDASVVPGASFVYRGRFDDGAGERTTSESDPVSIPAAGPATLALRARDGTVGRGWPVAFECRLAVAGDARVELVDVRGRIVAQRTIAGTPETPLLVSLSSDGAGAGLYFARLRQGRATSVVRVVRL